MREDNLSINNDYIIGIENMKHLYLISHVNAEALTTGRVLHLGTNCPQLRYRNSDSNKIVDIKFSTHDFLHKL